MPKATAVGELLAAIFHGKPVEKRLKEGKIWLIWTDCVGEQIASHARPAAFRDGTLTVSVDSAPWMQQLNFLKKQLMEKLNARLGEALVKDIYLRAGKREELPAPVQLPPKKVRTLSAEEKEVIAARSAAVTDPELREALASLMTRHQEEY